MESLNVLVTGGARGIGAGIVEELAKKGHNAAFCGRGSAEDAAERLDYLTKTYPGKFKYYQCDISKGEDRERLVSSFLADFGCIDILVNNAGVAPNVRADLLDMSEESFLRVLTINLQGPFFLTQLAAN